MALPAAAGLVQRYRIDTFAGGGSGPAVGDAGPATEAVLAAPTGLARDARGDVFIADHDHARVRRVRSCSDGNPATLDRCDPATGCRHERPPSSGVAVAP